MTQCAKPTYIFHSVDDLTGDEKPGPVVPLVGQSVQPVPLYRRKCAIIAKKKYIGLYVGVYVFCVASW